MKLKCIKTLKNFFTEHKLYSIIYENSEEYVIIDDTDCEHYLSKKPNYEGTSFKTWFTLEEEKSNPNLNLIGYTMKNSKGEYLAMDGGSTADWFKASKFDKSGIESRKMYLECGYELVEFQIKEGATTFSICGNYCDAELIVSVTKEELIATCSYCEEVVSKFDGKDKWGIPINTK